MDLLGGISVVLSQSKICCGVAPDGFTYWYSRNKPGIYAIRFDKDYSCFISECL